MFSFRPMTADVAAKVTSETSQRAELQAAVDVKLVSKNIEDLQLGQRVVGRNPLRHETQSPSEIDPATWRAVRLHMIQSGVEYDLAFLRPLSWLESTGAVVGGSIQMELHEMGLNGPARVVGIDPCPFIEPDDGTGRNVVTGTMAHPGANIVYLDITGLDEPLGVTDTHPIWSQTRQNFVVAGQLKVGEQFRTVTGQSATLTRIHPHRGPPEMVFNLEVDGQHVYHVASSGLLVHNDCSFVDLMSKDEADLYRKYWRGDMPAQVTPGIKNNVKQQLATNEQYSYTTVGHYDKYGRLTGRTDFTTHPSTGLLHADPHYHIRNETFGDKTADGFKTGNIAEWLRGNVPGVMGLE
ncbi:MAG: polymorphic toxin-type HINT domain-containing protein [Planctomyces sp.]